MSIQTLASRRPVSTAVKTTKKCHTPGIVMRRSSLMPPTSTMMARRMASGLGASASINRREGFPPRACATRSVTEQNPIVGLPHDLRDAVAVNGREMPPGVGVVRPQAPGAEGDDPAKPHDRAGSAVADHPPEIHLARVGHRDDALADAEQFHLKLLVRTALARLLGGRSTRRSGYSRWDAGSHRNYPCRSHNPRAVFEKKSISCIANRRKKKCEAASISLLAWVLLVRGTFLGPSLSPPL